jgi:hypothetical protein
MLPLVHPFYWGMWFVAAPVLIHLINMLRHQRVEWAAMEFLLLSQKKHRTWVIFKQLLLLLLRMAAIALVVLALAQPLLPDRWGSFLNPQQTHHIVLLDDSYSMSENLGTQTAFAQAKNAVQRLGDAVVRPRAPQSFTLLRFSRCGGRYGGTQPDFEKETVDADFGARLSDALKTIEVTETAAEPLPALEAIQQSLGENAGERRIVYLFTDFRTRQWDKPDELKKRLEQLFDDHAEIRLIDCAEGVSRPNVAISALEPEEGIRAAGVRWRMQVTVQNFGSSAARSVPIHWSADGVPGANVTIDSIAPGHAERKVFEVSFSVAGEHRIEASLDADAVNVDNRRFAVVDLPVITPVLLIDGKRSQGNARRIAVALTARKGIQPEIVGADYLVAPRRPLTDFAMIVVANVGKIERSGVEALEKYVAAGGGVLFVAGPETRGDYVTQDLYRNGKGLFPMPLALPAHLLSDQFDNTPDVQSVDHYVFQNIDHRVDHISAINVPQYFAAPSSWKAKSDPSLRVIMWLRNGAPLLVEKPFGKGRVLALLSAAAGDWNNWSTAEPSFAAFVLNVVPFLSRRFGAGEALLVGEPKTLAFKSPPFEPVVHFTGPGGDTSAATVNAESSGKDERRAVYTKTDISGFYKALLTEPSHKAEARNFAVNVDPVEGDLRALGGPDLAARLAPLKYEFEYAASYNTKLDETQGRNLGDALLLLLVLVLLLEQLFAWSCSYHISSRMTDPWKPGAVAKGGPA